MVWLNEIGADEVDVGEDGMGFWLLPDLDECWETLLFPLPSPPGTTCNAPFVVVALLLVCC